MLHKPKESRDNNIRSEIDTVEELSMYEMLLSTKKKKKKNIYVSFDSSVVRCDSLVVVSFPRPSERKEMKQKHRLQLLRRI